MEVLAADGVHVGTVDHLEGANRIKLTKSDPISEGTRHTVPVDWVDHVDAHVHLKNGKQRNPGLLQGGLSFVRLRLDGQAGHVPACPLSRVQSTAL